MSHLLELDDLRVEFHTRDGVARVLNGVSCQVDAGETLALLGESGSGKSVTAQAIMGILDSPPARVTGGRILYEGRDLLTMTPQERREQRGTQLAMVFQDALSALNPVFPVGWQVSEALRVRQGLDRSTARRRAIELMERVKIPGARTRIDDYPHQFSGGMRQRVMIAMALALDPRVLIADEPTTALDVTVQAQIMDLLMDLKSERGMALILITHDLGVVAQVADRIAVMYAGRIVEMAGVHELFRQPAHPYTRALLNSMPRQHHGDAPLATIQGLPPNLLHIPPGCPFHPRCTIAEPRCREDLPATQPVGLGRVAACHRAQGVLDGVV